MKNLFEELTNIETLICKYTSEYVIGLRNDIPKELFVRKENIQKQILKRKCTK